MNRWAKFRIESVILGTILVLGGCTTEEPAARYVQRAAHDKRKGATYELAEISPDLLRYSQTLNTHSRRVIIEQVRRRTRDEELKAYLDHLDESVRLVEEGDSALAREIHAHFSAGDHLYSYKYKTEDTAEEGWLILDAKGREKHRIVVGEGKPGPLY
jgi:hypothetical protein